MIIYLRDLAGKQMRFLKKKENPETTIYVREKSVGRLEI